MTFFFLFGAIKFVLAEGGSDYGCGRVCVKGDWDPLNNHTSHLGLKLSGRRCSMRCLKAGNPGYRTWVEAGLPGMSFPPTRSRRAFSPLAVKERNAILASVTSKELLLHKLGREHGSSTDRPV